MAYLEAVKVVIDFAKERKNVLVISTSDHETGGLTLGRTLPTDVYPEYAWYPEVVLKCKKSSRTVRDRSRSLIHSCRWPIW